MQSFVFIRLASLSLGFFFFPFSSSLLYIHTWQTNPFHTVILQSYSLTKCFELLQFEVCISLNFIIQMMLLFWWEAVFVSAKKKNDHTEFSKWNQALLWNLFITWFSSFSQELKQKDLLHYITAIKSQEHVVLIEDRWKDTGYVIYAGNLYWQNIFYCQCIWVIIKNSKSMFG